jgi:hypothetical protein
MYVNAGAPHDPATRLERSLRRLWRARPGRSAEAFRRFEADLPERDALRGAHALLSAPVVSEAHQDACFVLVYYGADYPHTLVELMEPYRIWRRALRDPSAHNTGVFGDRMQMALTGLGPELAILYERRRRARELRCLLEIGLDGGPAESLDIAVAEVWSRHAAAVLRTASGSEVMEANVASALTMECNPGSAGGAQARRRIKSRLRRLARISDVRVARAARAVLRDLHAGLARDPFRAPARRR